MSVFKSNAQKQHIMFLNQPAQLEGWHFVFISTCSKYSRSIMSRTEQYPYLVWYLVSAQTELYFFVLLDLPPFNFCEYVLILLNGTYGANFHNDQSPKYKCSMKQCNKAHMLCMGTSYACVLSLKKACLNVTPSLTFPSYMRRSRVKTPTA